MQFPFRKADVTAMPEKPSVSHKNIQAHGRSEADRPCFSFRNEPAVNGTLPLLICVACLFSADRV